jgi:hypothetical protein
MIRAMFALLVLGLPSPALAEFVGTLSFTPADCKASGQCELVYDFGYIDPDRVGWQAKAGLKSDGASIPSWAQPIIGGPWEEQFIRAAVIHDWYCIRTVRTRRATHRMFYNALIEGGVSRPKALTMYYAVTVGSHMWVKLMEGQKCSGLANCIQNTTASTQIPGATIRTSPEGELQAYRPPRFERPDIAKDIAEASAIIEGGAIDSPAAVEAMALSRHPNDFFLRNGDAVIYQGPSSKYPDR